MVAAGTWPAGMGAAPAAPIPGDNRLPGQRALMALYDWLVANKDGIDPTFMTEFHDACPGHRAKKCKGTWDCADDHAVRRSTAGLSGPTRRAARATGESWWSAASQHGDDFRAPEDTGAYGPGGPSTETAFPQTYKYGTGIQLAPGSPALVLTGSLAPSNPNRLPLASQRPRLGRAGDPASETGMRASAPTPLSPCGATSFVGSD